MVKQSHDYIHTEWVVAHMVALVLVDSMGDSMVHMGMDTEMVLVQLDLLNLKWYQHQMMQLYPACRRHKSAAAAWI